MDDFPTPTPGRLQRARARLIDVDRNIKRAVLAVWDALVAAGALWVALYLRFGSATYPHDERYDVLYILLPIIMVAIFLGVGLYRLLLRSMDTGVVFLIAGGAAVCSITIMVWDYFEQTMFVPRSVPIIYFMVAFVGIGLARLALKTLYEFLVPRGLARRKVAILSNGDGGLQVARALRNARGYRVVALFDVANLFKRSTVGGVRVHKFKNLKQVVQQLDVKEILVTDRDLLTAQRDTLAALVSDTGVMIKHAPSVEEVLDAGTTRLSTPAVRIEDLLGRQIVAPIAGLIEGSIGGRTVVVTGAAGSIGSEICRQVLAAGAARLVAFDASEYGLYALDQELRPSLAPGVELDIRLGSVTDTARVNAVMADARPELVYHAAAYKHVPLVEANPLAGVRNNVFGTRVVAQAAIAVGARRFVLISTDKAVRPTNVMGSSKRLSELVVQDLQTQDMAQQGGTILSMVRFGNVLGSSGSVVPLFQRQIENGGPVTLTNRNVTRYFMTIREAAQLVLQAGFMARGGEVFVLDMGEPVKLFDLARMMIQLSGHRVREEPGDGGIEIREIGLRPGEKMYEELLIGGDVVGTDHPKIMRAMERRMEHDELAAVIAELDRAIATDDAAAAVAIMEQHGDLNRETAVPAAERRPKLSLVN